MKIRPSTVVLLVGLALVCIRARLTDQFLATDFGEAVGLTFVFVVICVAAIGALLRLLECPHADTKPRMNTNKLTSQSR